MNVSQKLHNIAAKSKLQPPVRFAVIHLPPSTTRLYKRIRLSIRFATLKSSELDVIIDELLVVSSPILYTADRHAVIEVVKQKQQYRDCNQNNSKGQIDRGVKDWIKEGSSME